MLKRLLLLSLVFISLTAQSQVLITLLLGDKLNSPNLEFGLEGGINWSSMDGFESNDYSQKWNLGFYFDFKIKNQLSFYTGVLVKSNLGIDNLTHNDLNSMQVKIYKDNNGDFLIGNYSNKLNYFLVPALIRYKFKKGVYGELGPQFGLMYKSWVEFNSDYEGSDAVIKEYNKDALNKIDVGAMIGFGYKFQKGPGWTLGVKYYYGLVDVYKNISGTKNSSFFIKLNIPIGANKKSDKPD